MEQVEVERAYRVIGMLEKLALAVRDEAVPALEEARAAWRRRVLLTDAALLAVLAAAAVAIGFQVGFDTATGWLGAAGFGTALGAAVLLVAAGYVHFQVRRMAARACRRRLVRGWRADSPIEADWLGRAFAHGTSTWRTMWIAAPAGWGGAAKRKVADVLEETGRYVQRLNDRFADPSGRSQAGPEAPEPDHPGEAPGRKREEQPDPNVSA